MKGKEQCENTRLVGYDPTGESAVLCSEPGEYCPDCEMVLCPSCHAEVTSHPLQAKKPPVRVAAADERELRKSRG